eukprot:5591005-Pleurochrysis_carterae.AAC.1
MDIEYYAICANPLLGKMQEQEYYVICAWSFAWRDPAQLIFTVDDTTKLSALSSSMTMTVQATSSFVNRMIRVQPRQDSTYYFLVSAGRNHKLLAIALQPTSSVLCFLIRQPGTATLVLSAYDPS